MTTRTASFDRATGSHTRASRTQPTVVLRAQVRCRRFGLDRALAEGADPASSPALALRAEQLVTARLQMAERLEHVVAGAWRRERGPGRSAQAPVQRVAVREAQPYLRRLVADLREVQRPRPQGVARAHLLLTDGSGPLFAPTEQGTLARVARNASDALTDGWAQ